MRSIRPQLTPELTEWLGSGDMATADAIRVTSFRQLVQQVAQLSYLNKDLLFFYRGQSRDHLNKAGASTFYPTIYRGERVPKEQLILSFEVLESAGARLCDALQNQGIDGHRDVRRRKHIQWGILQHYEVCATPLLDFTQSLLVACSFAFLDKHTKDPFVFVFGLPYVTNRVSVNSEHDLVNVRLLSICPPRALRPYFQEGYVAGTDEVTVQFDSKTELDFNNRLVAKFQLVGGQGFWGRGFQALTREVLYPSKDAFEEVCTDLRETLDTRVSAGNLGAFLREWTELESGLVSSARSSRSDHRIYSAWEAFRELSARQQLPDRMVDEFNELRSLRNDVVHRPDRVDAASVIAKTDTLRALRRMLADWNV